MSQARSQTVHAPRRTRKSRQGSPAPVQAVTHVDRLETRQLLAATDNIAFNFQPAGATIPSGYVADTGLTYRSQNGVSFGWDRDNRSSTRDRNRSGTAQQYDTLTHFGGGRAQKWEVAVPNGQYTVSITAGDGSFVDSNYRINVESNLVVNQRPTWNNRYVDGTTTVNVTDGRLTVTSASGASNNKINYIRIRKVGTTPSNPTNPTNPTTPTNPNRPATPSDLRATNRTNNSISLAWRDNSGIETGYQVERSTDGGNSYSRIANLGRNSTSYTATGLSAGRTYHFRVRAVADQITGDYSNRLQTSTTGGATPGGQDPVNNNINRRALAGVNANIDSNDPFGYEERLDDLGVKDIRIWYRVRSWGEQPNAWFINRAAKFKQMGFNVMLTVLDDTPGSYNEVKGFFQRLVNYPGIRNIVDLWQIGNEPNHTPFWKGTLSQYVNTFLKPASEVLRPLGEKVVGAAPTWDVRAAESLRDLGYLNWVDFAAFHPYARTADQVLERVRGAKAAFAGKPLILSEWNMNDVGNTSFWASELNRIAPEISRLVHSAYFFGLVKTGGGFSSDAHLLNRDRSPNGEFYRNYERWTTGTVD